MKLSVTNKLLIGGAVFCALGFVFYATRKIECNRCGWNWKVADGGNDLFVCHKCGNDNEPNK
tara:strand:+ start:647 stop:832 length:186 start_codon:yes stop_codon:yes gene_type:complete